MRSVTARNTMASSADWADGCSGVEASDDIEDVVEVGDRDDDPSAKLRFTDECLPLPRWGESRLPLPVEPLPLPAPAPALPPAPDPAPPAAAPALPPPPNVGVPVPAGALVGVTVCLGCRPTNTGAECRIRTLTTSRILPRACLWRMDMNALPGGRQMAGPMMVARLAAVDAAEVGAIDDVGAWHSCNPRCKGDEARTWHG